VTAEKISVSLSSPLIKFIETYKNTHQHKSRSQVIEIALQLLQQQELEAAYREANQEDDFDWEVTAADGLANETW
jgi:Arc/MetJ-type ribon-helix-helix transcriptional regulator